MQQARENAVLDKVFRFEEGTMSRRDWLKLMKSQGATVEANRVRQHAKEEKEREDLRRLFNHMPFGNQNHPQCKEYYRRKAELEQGFFKDQYSLSHPAQKWSIVITKIEHDIFSSL